MPRGSRTGERRGGRQRGTPNKATVAKAAALEAASADPTTTPLQFLLGVMRDPETPTALRVQVARAALVHAKPGIAPRSGRPAEMSAPIEARGFGIDLEEAKMLRDMEHRLAVFFRKRNAPSENGGPLTAAEIAEEPELDAMYKKRAAALVCPPGYAPGDATEDSNRLHQLHCKRLTPSSCGGGDLKGAENEEEFLTARVAAFRHSQEGRDRHRITVLEVFRRYRESEQAELDELRVKYPKSPTTGASAIGLKLAELRNRVK